MYKRILLIAAVLAFVAAVTGCNTVHGMGQDLSAGGQAISDVAS